MPDFDTRTPQEPDRPNRLQMFIVASRQRISAVGGLSRNMIRHRWKLLLSLLLLVIAAVLIKDWAVQTPAEQLDQEIAQLDRETKAQLDHKIHLPPTPEYSVEADSEASASAGHSCEPGFDSCIAVRTEAYLGPELASITVDVLDGVEYGTNFDPSKVSNLNIEFYRSTPLDLIGESYCFDSKDNLVATLGERLDYAEVLGTVNDCYIAVF